MIIPEKKELVEKAKEQLAEIETLTKAVDNKGVLMFANDSMEILIKQLKNHLE